MLEWTQVEGDIHSEINASLANGHSYAFKVQGGVIFAVANHDIATTPAHQFVKPHVIEMAAIAEIDVVAGVVGSTQQFAD